MGGARALWFVGPREAEIREEPIPTVGPRDLLVDATCSAVSHGTEMLVYRGEVPPDLALDLPTLAGSFDFPIKYGYASVGRVREVGGEVEGIQPDSLVFCLHPHQTAYVLSADLAWPLPEGLAPERAAFAANVETALNVLLDAPVRLGERVVVLGQGTVGMLVGMLARQNGAGRVAVVDPIERRRTLAVSLAADAALTPEDATPDTLADVLGGRPDVVYEVSTSPAALQTAIDAVADEGTVMVCSWYGTKTVPMSLGGRFHRGRLSIRSTQVGHIAPELGGRWSYQRRRETVIGLLGTLPLDRLVSHRYPFEQAPAAYQAIDERPAETVQVLLTYGGAADSERPR